MLKYKKVRECELKTVRIKKKPLEMGMLIFLQ